jgi:hypothetical protein
MGFNPLDHVTQQDIQELGLTPFDLLTARQPSGGGVYHCRGAEGMGKTLWGSHFYRYLVDSGRITPLNSYGNLTFKGKYGDGFTVLKGETLHEFLWDLTHKPYRNKFVFIDEIDSEFPARFFSSKTQTEIALRMWHTNKLNNYIVMTSHIGNSTDLIFSLASHYVILPDRPNLENNTLDFTFINNLELWHDDFTATDIYKTMLIYNRKELTEDSGEEQSKKYTKKKAVIIEDNGLDDLDLEKELDL